MNVIIPLLGSAAAGWAAFFAYKKVTSEWMLEEEYKHVRDEAAKISASSKHPATVLILGFENHGRSSFVNTMFRVLYRENGPLVMRAETGPSKKTTTTARVFRVKNKIFRFPKYLLNLIDTPTFSASQALDVDDLRTILRGKSVRESAPFSSRQKNFPVPECVVLIIRSDSVTAKGPAYERIPELVNIIREEGLQFVIVLTHKKEVRKVLDLQELTRQVAQRAGTDSVHCIDNYVAEHYYDRQNGARVSNNFETHIQTLGIVRQCFEYVKRRRQMAKKSNSMHKSKSLSALDEFKPSQQDSTSSE